MDQNEYIDSIINKFEESAEFANIKIVQYFKGKSKSEIKSEIEDMATNTIKFMWFEIFEKREEYEICQAYKEVLEERYSNPIKFRENAVREIYHAFESIQQFREIMGNGPDITEWKDILELINDRDVAAVFYELFPVEKVILKEIEWYRQRLESNQVINLEAEIIGVQDIPIASLKSRLLSIYPNSELFIEITGNKMSFTFKNENSIEKVLEFVDCLPLTN